jgi:DNA-binding PadR family transcriptional regulator
MRRSRTRLVSEPDMFNTYILLPSFMPVQVDPSMTDLFGSEVRVRTLALLAGSEKPISAYRVAQATGDQGTQVYSVLRKAREGGLVEESQAENGSSIWFLTDSDLRAMLKRRVRISVASDFLELSSRKSEPRPAPKLDLSNFRGEPVSSDSEQYRPPEKDELLERRGLRSRRQTIEAWSRARKRP